MALPKNLIRTEISAASILNDSTLSTSATKKEIDKIYEIPLDRIRLNDNQPRQEYDQDKIQALAESIKSDGLIQPIVVSQTGTRPVIIAGHRRYKAYELLGEKTIPCIVDVKRRDHSDFTKLALIENLQREGLNSLEIAKGLKELQDEANVSQRELARITGYNEGHVSKYLNVYEKVKNDKERQTKLKELGIFKAYNYYCNVNKRKRVSRTEKEQNAVIFDVNIKVKNNAESIQNTLEEMSKIRKKLRTILKKLS